MADGDADLPRWGGVTEPTTVATNVVLAVLAFVFAARLVHRSAVESSAAGAWLAAALLATGFAALIGAIAHATDPSRDAALRERFWRSTLYATGLIGAATIASVAYFAARGYARAALLLFAAIKLVVYLYRVAREPEFRIAAVDYGIALAIVVIGAVTELVRRRAPGMAWLIAGVLVSLVGGIVQARRLALHRQFNHNDLYHVIQMAALYAFYRGGALLVDR
jgi:predicted membrane channel-forming protein YqfA (hemolysin III family)